MSSRSSLATTLVMGLALGLLLSVSMSLTGCSGDELDTGGLVNPTTEVKATCEGCHTSEASLRTTALPDPPPPEDSGEG